MKYTDNEMSIILLCSHIGITKDADIKPLTLGEWNGFVTRLIDNKLEPSMVYNINEKDIVNLGYDSAFADRLQRLSNRGAAVAFELQEYEKKGINVVTEISKDYPIMLRRVLKAKKPPVLMYAGNIELAKKVGIGVVGSRNVSADGIDFTKELVSKATHENMIVYSGGARGVDTTSETVALNEGGGVVSYIADSLVSKIKKADITRNIADGRMLLISDQKAEAGFSAGRAMNRNKYIYASGYGTFVVESDYNKGGTWNGATEALKNQWGKVLVWDNGSEGNSKLIEAGGIPFRMGGDSGIYDTIGKAVKDNSTENKVTSGEVYEQLDITSFIDN